jgi:type I restriction enzyme S subunit
MEVKPGYKQTEIGVIPEDWEVLSLNDACIKIQDGTHFSPKIGGSQYKYITSKNIGKGSLSLNNVDMISEEEHRKIYKRCDVKIGDVLLTKDGINTGNTAINHLNEEFSLLSSVALLRIDPKYHNNLYLMYQILSDQGQARITNMISGNAITRLSLDKIKKLSFPFPSTKHEQKLIAEKILSIDSFITSLEKLIKKKKLIKQGVMQELLIGKRRLPGFSGEWETKRYGDIFQFLSTANYTREDLTDTGSLKYIHYGDIHTKFENYVDLSDALIPTIQDCRLKNYPLLESGDIIMVDASEDYSGVGKSVEVINSNGCKAISGLHTILLRDISKIFADGYRAFIHSIPSVKAQLDFYATGMKVYSISKGNLARIEIPVPPKDEQEAIVNTLGRFVDEIKGLDIRLAKCKLLKQAMMQVLLTGRIRLI